MTRLNGALAVATMQLNEKSGAFSVSNLKIVWKSTPNVVSTDEWGGRIAFAPDGKHMFVTSGDRSVYYPTTALDNTLGKIVRLNLDGSVHPDNLFAGIPGALPEIWTLGHRNPIAWRSRRTGRCGRPRTAPRAATNST